MSVVSKNSKILQLLNYRLKITIHDGRTFIGQMIAFDKHMNLVLAECEEFRKIKPKPGSGSKTDKEEKRSLGLVILRGENIVSLSVEAPPPVSSEDTKRSAAAAAAAAAAAPGIGRPAGRGMPMAPPAASGMPVGPAPGLGGLCVASAAQHLTRCSRKWALAVPACLSLVARPSACRCRLPWACPECPACRPCRLAVACRRLHRVSGRRQVCPCRLASVLRCRCRLLDLPRLLDTAPLSSNRSRYNGLVRQRSKPKTRSSMCVCVRSGAGMEWARNTSAGASPRNRQQDQLHDSFFPVLLLLQSLFRHAAPRAALSVLLLPLCPSAK
ncbi:hypothetical protein BC831DRAFT_501895 [Entophlyctis helioformis]|nr:hypothetical protein BC831DRAFT_501895 [Entophlyctis helioformis]